ncbi:MAG TPA: zinc ribbon domain-containing protein [Thermosynechococcaceae cyanobacterium]
MPACPRCRQPVETRAIVCPYCRTALKAHGHPGIILHRAVDGEPLCLTCTYHADDTCTFPKRPDAMDCTLYTDLTLPLAIAPKYPRSLRGWLKQNSSWIALLALVLVSLVLVLLR